MQGGTSSWQYRVGIEQFDRGEKRGSFKRTRSVPKVRIGVQAGFRCPGGVRVGLWYTSLLISFIAISASFLQITDDLPIWATSSGDVSSSGPTHQSHGPGICHPRNTIACVLDALIPSLHCVFKTLDLGGALQFSLIVFFTYWPWLDTQSSLCKLQKCVRSKKLNHGFMLLILNYHSHPSIDGMYTCTKYHQVPSPSCSVRTLGGRRLFSFHHLPPVVNSPFAIASVISWSALK